MPEPLRWTAFDLAEGLHLAYAAATLHHLGVLSALDPSSTSDEVADRFKLDREMLSGMLAYLAARTSLVVRRDDRYLLGEDYNDSARFVLDLHVRAFGPVSAALPLLIRDGRQSGALVDREAQASAFADDRGDLVLAGILRQLGLFGILEFGCGSGALLRTMARSDPGFVGVGVDANSAMCRIARASVRTENLEPQLRILQGDARDPHLWREIDAPRIAAVVARDLLNEMCRGGGGEAASFLRTLRARLPGRVLVVADYYGQLGRCLSHVDRRVLLHDFVQLVSGQGVPPSDLSGWTALYEAAECSVVHAIEDPGSARFVHLVRL